jgi:asparagine synthase (glutamine-hydrolysing)
MELFGLGPARSPGSGILKGIEGLPPAWAALYHQVQFKSWEYWRLQAAPHLDSEEETVARVRELLVDAITRQLAADVPVVTFLSGGLDSSTISSVAGQEFRKEGKTLQTWPIDYRDNKKFFKESLFQPDPDSAWTGPMSHYLGSQHQNVVIRPRQLADALDQVVFGQ